MVASASSSESCRSTVSYRNPASIGSRATSRSASSRIAPQISRSATTAVVMVAPDIRTNGADLRQWLIWSEQTDRGAHVSPVDMTARHPAGSRCVCHHPYPPRLSTRLPAPGHHHQPTTSQVGFDRQGSPTVSEVARPHPPRESSPDPSRSSWTCDAQQRVAVHPTIQRGG